MQKRTSSPISCLLAAKWETEAGEWFRAEEIAWIKSAFAFHGVEKAAVSSWLAQEENPMAIAFSENLASKVLEARVTDRLTHADYQQFVARFETMLKLHGKLNVLFQMVNLHGWDAAVMWDDIKFDVKHFSDIERLAIVGDRAWEKTMSAVSRFFTTAKLRYFDTTAIDEARAWVASS